MDTETEWCAIDNLAEIEKERETYKQQIDNLQKALDDLQKRLDARNHEYSDLDQALCHECEITKGLTLVLAEEKHKNANLEAKVNELIEEKKVLESHREYNLSYVDAKMTDLKTQLSYEKLENQKLHSQMQLLSHNIDESTKQLFEERKKQQELELEHQEKLVHLKEKLEEVAMTFEDGKYELVKYYEKRLEDEKIRSDKEIDELVNQRKDLENQAGENSKLMDKLEDVHHQLDREKEYTAYLTTTITTVQKDKEKMSEEQELLASLLETEKREDHERKILYEKTNAKLQQLENERKLLLEQNKKIRDEKLKIASQLSDKDDIIRRLKNTYEQYCEKVKNAWEKREKEFAQSYMALDPHGFVCQF